MPDRPHKQLEVWKHSIDFVKTVYHATGNFPSSEKFGLTTQLQRASVSIPSNIAEGLTRSTVKDKLHFLNIAQASVSEVDTQLEIALGLGYLCEQEFKLLENSLTQVGKMLGGLIRHYRRPT